MLSQNKKNFFFDTSILSLIAFTKKNEDQNITIKNWELFLDEMDRIHENFSDIDFTWIWTPSLFLELIGFGGIKIGLKKEVLQDEWKNFIDGDNLRSDDFCKQIAKKIKSYLREHLTQSTIYRKALVGFLRNFQNHMNSHQIASRIKKRAKEIRDDKEQYIGLLQAIFLDAMFRYPYINLKAISPKDRELAMKLWAEVMGRLTRNYFEIREDGYDYSPLGLFSEINRTAGCYNSESPDKTPYDLLVRIWDDMADSDSINYALLGKSQNPVHVVTLDKRSDVERRIKCLANNLYELESRGFASKFFPGTITIFDHELKSAELIKVKDLIYVKSKQ